MPSNFVYYIFIFLGGLGVFLYGTPAFPIFLITLAVLIIVGILFLLMSGSIRLPNFVYYIFMFLGMMTFFLYGTPHFPIFLLVLVILLALGSIFLLSNNQPSEVAPLIGLIGIFLFGIAIFLFIVYLGY